MGIISSQVTKLHITGLDRLDPVHVFIENLRKGEGRITITCYGKAWSSYWGAMGSNTLEQFFCSANEQYLSNKLSTIDSESYDVDAIRKDAEERGIECWRDDPWNDYDFLNKMYGGDMIGWHDSLPKMVNPDYSYLCRIIKAVQDALAELKVS